MNLRMADWIRVQARYAPETRCFVTETDERTFGEVNTRVNRVATSLARLGVAKGDRVALFATDSPEYIETLLACLKLGAVFVPLNCRLAAPELQAMLSAATPKVLFFSGRYHDLIQAMDSSGPLRTVGYDTDVGDESYAGLLEQGVDVEIDVAVADSDTACLAFTSGTTGTPKGAVHSHRFGKHLVATTVVLAGLTRDSFHFSAAPQFHIAGMYWLLSGIARGYASLVLPRFDPPTVGRWMASGGLTQVFLVPTMIDLLLDEPLVQAAGFPHLQTIVYGGAPMSPALLRRAMDRFGCDFVNAFGAGTEAGIQTVLEPADHRRAAAGEEHLLGSIGRPAFGVDLRLCDDTWQDVPDGEVGEISTRADGVMDGYLDRPSATAEVLRDGWFRSGDMARRDREGYLYLAGRKKDMIIRGGENVYPVEIENVLVAHPAVRDAAVIGVPDPRWGEVVHAHLVLEAGEEFDEVAVQSHCRAHLAAYKLPARFLIHTELPRNPSGKVLKRTLRERTPSGDDPDPANSQHQR